jgi:hypothetical protein
MPEQTGLAVRKTIVVEAPVALAFQVFTEEMSTWWPLATHSVFDEHATRVTVEPRVGGRVYETSDAGEESEWGRVTAWDPPTVFAMTWHPGADPAEYTDLEVRFTVEGNGTRVDLVHTGWERRGAAAADMAKGYTGGWDVVLGFYTQQLAARA